MTAAAPTPMTAPTKTPRTGRPVEVDYIVLVRKDGTPVTAGQQIIERAQLGLDYQSCADSAGISRAALHKWRLAGARARAKEARGKGELSAQEASLRDFVDGLERAESEWEASRLAIIQRSAQGGTVVTKTTEKWTPPAAGQPPVMVERTVVTETLRPEWTAAAWQLERRKPAKYARRTYNELTGKDGAPLVPQEEQARGMADSLRDYLQGIADEKAAAKK